VWRCRRAAISSGGRSGSGRDQAAASVDVWRRTVAELPLATRAWRDSWMEATVGVVGVGGGGGAGGDGRQPGVEEGISEELDEGGRAHAAEGGEDKGEVVSLQQLAPRGVLGDLLRGASREDPGGGECRRVKVGREEGAGEGGVDSEGAGPADGGEDGVHLAAVYLPVSCDPHTVGGGLVRNGTTDRHDRGPFR
jgi:hypothetical protein